MTSKRLAAVIAAVAIILGGCNAPTQGGTPTQGTSPKLPDVPSETIETTEPSPQPETSEPTQPREAKFGTWYTYTDGLRIRVTAPKRIPNPDREFDPSVLPSAIKVIVTITNGTGKPVDLMTSATLTYGDAGVQADMATSVGDLNTGMGNLLPGRSQTGPYGWGLPKGAQSIDIEITPVVIDYETVHYTGTVK